MTSISSTNSAALLILQRPGSTTNASASAGAETDLVKIANGAPTVSSEPSKASIQAAAAAGKFALDTAPEVSANEDGYQLSGNDGGLAARMAAASNAEPTRRSEEESIRMMDAFDALSIKHGGEPLHASIRASILKTGGW